MSSLMELPTTSSAASSPSGSEPVWIVPLLDHPPYNHVRMKRVFTADGTRHQVVLVDARKLLACADRDNTDYVLRPVNEWHQGKVRGIREFLDPSNARIPQMPYVTITTRRAPGLLGWLRLEHEGVVAFRNGQHRARYMLAAGAVWFPVEVHEREAALLRQYCGAPDDARTALRPGSAGADVLPRT
ncbi:plasmid fertility inhibition factor family protein [Paraburkholderia diazotrophica]|uniref:plasmid fertility inhibition factor family protein n=1 Tax=Paraburkholderia diazotrophica TaxID=667676 RepID=UPI00317F9601